jgi:hypothetical protein
MNKPPFNVLLIGYILLLNDIVGIGGGGGRRLFSFRLGDLTL